MALDTPSRSVRPPAPQDLGRRRLIALGKLLVPAAAALVVVALVVLPALRSDPVGDAVQQRERRAAADLTAAMISPRFEGRDGRGRPFAVTASTADFASDDQRFVRLELPEGDLLLSDGSWVAITAARGIYDREDRLMQLAGQVNLFHDQGFELVTESAWLDLPAGRAEGGDPVTGQGPIGHIESQGFRIEERGARVIFTGESRLLLYGEPPLGSLP